MRVAVLGAGALGRVFGVRLAQTGVDVDFVVRPPRLGDGAMRVQAIDSGSALELDAPSRVTAVPPHADVVLVCVRAEQIDEAVAAVAAGPAVPAVLFTPLLPKAYARAQAALGGRGIMGISSVTGYVNDDGVARYWVSKAARTTLDERAPVDPVLPALAAALGHAGIDARLELGVHETAPATAILFAPLAIALDAAGSVDALLADRALLGLAFRAQDEARELSSRVGKLPGWTGLLTRFLGPFVLKMSVGLVKRRTPEGITYVEQKLGRSNRAQNALTGTEMLALASEKGTPRAALEQLVARVT